MQRTTFKSHPIDKILATRLADSHIDMYTSTSTPFISSSEEEHALNGHSREGSTVSTSASIKAIKMEKLEEELEEVEVGEEARLGTVELEGHLPSPESLPLNG